jgi:hypothetical protein
MDPSPPLLRRAPSPLGEGCDSDFSPSPLGRGGTARRGVRGFFAGDALNRSRIATVVWVPLTSNLKWALAPGNVHLSARLTGLPKASAANVSLIVSVDKDLLT